MKVGLCQPPRRRLAVQAWEQSELVHLDLALYSDFEKNVVLMFKRRARLFKDAAVT